MEDITLKCKYITLDPLSINSDGWQRANIQCYDRDMKPLLEDPILCEVLEFREPEQWVCHKGLYNEILKIEPNLSLEFMWVGDRLVTRVFSHDYGFIVKSRWDNGNVTVTPIPSTSNGE